MIFESPRSRYFLRAGVTAALAVVGVAATIWIDNPYVKMASAGLGVLGAYLGVGAAVPSVEPFVGNQYQGAEVPIPPAVDEDV